MFLGDNQLVRRILVTGSRDWEDEALIRFALEQVWHPDAVLVHGACPPRYRVGRPLPLGADALADRCWRAWGGQVDPYPAAWAIYGKRAGLLRNWDMIGAGADVCFAFIKNRSRGASHCAAWADVAGIPTYVFP